jgi:trans-aconitate methyltransferase
VNSPELAGFCKPEFERVLPVQCGSLGLDLRSYVKNGDLGCGPGFLHTEALADSVGDEGKVYAFDSEQSLQAFSPKLGYGRKKIKNLIPKPKPI